MPRAGETLKPQTLTPPSQVILASEAFREEAINRASGEAEAILHTAAATSKVGFGGLGGGGISHTHKHKLSIKTTPVWTGARDHHPISKS